MHKRKSTRNELTKNIFRSTLQFPREFISHLAQLSHAKWSRRPFHSTLQLSKLHNKWYWSWDEYPTKIRPVFRSPKIWPLFISKCIDRPTNEWSLLNARWVPDMYIILMESRFKLPITPSYRFRLSTARSDFYILYYRNLLNVVRQKATKSAYAQTRIGIGQFITLLIERGRVCERMQRNKFINRSLIILWIILYLYVRCWL